MVAFFVMSIALHFGIVSSLFLAQQSFIVQDYNLTYDFTGFLLFLTQIGWLAGAFIIFLIGKYISNIHFIAFSLLLAFLVMLFFATMNREMLLAYGEIIFLLVGIGMTFCWVPMTDVITTYVNDKIRPTVMILITGGTCWGLLLIGYLIANSTPTKWQELFEIGAIVSGICFALFATFYYGFNRDVMAIKSPESPKESASKVGSSYKKLIAVIYISNFLMGFSFISFNSYYSVYLDEELFLNTSTIGTAWTINGVIGILSAILLGRAVGIFGYKKSIGLAYVLLISAIGALFIANISPQFFAYFAIILFALAYYPVYGMFPSYMSTIFKSGITKIFAMANLLSGLGAGVGSYLGGLIKHETTSLHGMYFVIIGAVLIMTILLMTLPKQSQN